MQKYWLNFQVDGGKPQPVQKCFSEYGNLQMATSGNGLTVGVEQLSNQIVVHDSSQPGNMVARPNTYFSIPVYEVLMTDQFNFGDIVQFDINDGVVTLPTSSLDSEVIQTYTLALVPSGTCQNTLMFVNLDSEDAQRINQLQTGKLTFITPTPPKPKPTPPAPPAKKRWWIALVVIILLIILLVIVYQYRKELYATYSKGRKYFVTDVQPNSIEMESI